MKFDLLTVVERASDLEPGEAAWLQNLTEAIAPFIDDGYGAYGTTVDASNPARLQIGTVVHCGGSERFVQAIKAVNSGMSNALAERAYRSGSGITTATQRVGIANWRRAAEMTRTSEIQDCASVVSVDESGRGSMVLAPLNRVHRYSRQVGNAWSRVSAHLEAMYRLRQALSGARAREARQGGEAVLTPGARVAHAEGVARDPSARALLRDAAISSERARGRLRRSAPDEALEIWRVLAGGRWSIVDRFDHDGRRFLVAHANEPQAIGARALSDRERQVVSRVGMGHSNKLIAYELGISTGSVGGYLHTAMRKLGIHSRTDLARLARAAWMTPLPRVK